MILKCLGTIRALKNLSYMYRRISSGGFRPGPGGGHKLPVLLQPTIFVVIHDFFAKIIQISDFFALSNFRKVHGQICSSH